MVRDWRKRDLSISHRVYLFLLRIINAAMMPGTQPTRVSRNTISIEPQPRSITASGGKIMARMTWRQDMNVDLGYKNKKNRETRTVSMWE